MGTDTFSDAGSPIIECSAELLSKLDKDNQRFKAELTAIKQVVGEVAVELNEAIEEPINALNVREHGINEGTLTRLATRLESIGKGTNPCT
jgi:hypothetical protein